MFTIPQALAKLGEALQKLLKDKLPPTYHPAYAGVPAPKAEVVTPPKVRVSSGIGDIPFHGRHRSGGVPSDRPSACGP